MLLIFCSWVTLLAPHEAQLFFVLIFVSPCLWYAVQAYQRKIDSQIAGMWRERIRGVRG